jgi:ataxin-3
MKAAFGKCRPTSTPTSRGVCFCCLRYVILANIFSSSKDYLNRIAEGSGNVDPSGNFSIQVLRAALQGRYGLDLPNIAQEGVAEMGDVTEIDGFICNRQAHWFAIRKINGRYWNLNSMEKRPKIISHFQLAKEIKGYQESGYSVFCVHKGLPSPCTSKAQRDRGLPKYWWKEDDLVNGRGDNATTGATDPWKDVGSGMRLDGSLISSGEMTEEQMLQMALAASLEQPVSRAEETVELTPEPQAGAEGAVRIQFRLPGGKRSVRRFLGTDSVRMLYSFVNSDCDSHGQRLELRFGFPPRDLQTVAEKTIAEAALDGEAIQCRLI